MEKSIQDKINQLKKLANKPKLYTVISEKNTQNEDSLSLSIRNKKEANMFLSELKFAIDLAASKK